MLEYEVRPLTDLTWVGGGSDVDESSFTASWPDTLDLLEKEIDHLKGTDVVIALNVPSSAIRNDGKLRANAVVGERPVEVSFESEVLGERQVHQNARFVRGSAYGYKARTTDDGERVSGRVQKMSADWMHNVRSVALTLKALRDIDRWGSGRGEQYSGYKALGSGSGALASGMTADDATRIVLTAAGEPVSGADVLIGVVTAKQIKRARAATHPDRPENDGKQYALVAQATEVLTRAGRVAP